MTGTNCAQISRADVVMRRFGVTSPVRVVDAQWQRRLEDTALGVIQALRPGRIVLVCGASGSGKSLLIERIGQLRPQAVALDGPLPDELVCDCLPWLELEHALEVLARFGLGEVYTYLSPARLLSTGQQYRLKLARAYARLKITRRRGLLLADEFVTQLDHVSAIAVARNLRKAIGGEGALSAVVATCRDDILKALKPDVVVRADFGEYGVD